MPYQYQDTDADILFTEASGLGCMTVY